jgi:hypothetical protein
MRKCVPRSIYFGPPLKVCNTCDTCNITKAIFGLLQPIILLRRPEEEKYRRTESILKCLVRRAVHGTVIGGTFSPPDVEVEVQQRRTHIRLSGPQESLEYLDAWDGLNTGLCGDSRDDAAKFAAEATSWSHTSLPHAAKHGDASRPTGHSLLVERALN